MIAEFDDPRLVALYDTVNAYGPGEQPDFYAALALELGAVSIVDLGCGTGLVTRDLARRVRGRVTGIDPSSAMLGVARSRPGADQVRWLCGASADASGPGAHDLAIMTGHVAQFFLTDDTWHAALVSLHRALRPGGHLAFESRNPDARAWEAWSHASADAYDDPRVGRIETSTDVDDERAGIVTYTNRYRVIAAGEVLMSAAQLRFRSLEQLTESLAAAGFAIERVYGDWDRSPVGPTQPELIVVGARIG